MFRIIIIVAVFIGLVGVGIAFVFTIDFECPQPVEDTGIQAQLTGAGGSILPDDGVVLFDTILNDQSDQISYNPATGEFTITAPGNYFVSWSVATDGAGPAIFVSYAVTVDGLPYAEMSSPIVSGELSGEALVTITTAPAVITLVNVTGDSVFVPLTPVQANIVILELDQ